MSDAPLTLSDLIRYLEAVGTGKVHCRSCNGTTFTPSREADSAAALGCWVSSCRTLVIFRRRKF